MFANPWWSVLVLALPFALYFLVIRPRLRVKFTQTYAYLDGFWERLWARTVAFRSYLVGVVTALAIALPDLLVLIPGLDLSFLPQPWPMYVTSGSTAALVLMRAFSTTQREQPPA